MKEAERERSSEVELRDYEGWLTIDVNINGEIKAVEVYKFIEKFIKIEDESGDIIDFRLNEAQIEIYKELVNQKRRGEAMRLNILKARQLGCSTFIGALFFVLTIFVPGRKAVIVADLAEHATNLFKKYVSYYEMLPERLKLKRVANNAKVLEVAHGNGQTSSIRIIVQGENAGRSGTYQYLHLSEAAFWDNLEGTLTSLLQTVHSTNKDSIVIFETTGNGFNEYKSRWDKDYTGKTQYKPMFFPWYTDRRNVRPYTRFELEPWEKELKNKFSLSLEQVAFYREKYNDFNGDIQKLKQEYPSLPIEAFKTTGTSVFSVDLIQERKEILSKYRQERGKWWESGFFSYTKKVNEQGDQITVTRCEFRPSYNGHWLIYKRPIKGHPYIISVDPAMGGKDDYAVQVLDNYAGEQVAVFYAPKVDVYDLSFQIYACARWYNQAVVNAECNNSTGTLILQNIYMCGYGNIYQDKPFDSITERYNERLGYKTTVANKNAQISLLKTAFESRNLVIYDWKTLCEMETYSVFTSDKARGKEQYGAIVGEHDDLVMAMCGVFIVRQNRGQTTLLEKEIPPLKRGWSIFDDDNVMERRSVYQIWD